MQDKSKMPLLFVGHGSPMNAIEDNEYTKGWESAATAIGKPQAILMISAHWETDGTRVSDAAQQRIVYDMYGFPAELYAVKYPVLGTPATARAAMAAITSRDVLIDNDWGIDHGAWSVLRKMYPEANVPVCQLSLDRKADASTHFHIGQQLSKLREQGVLIVASGNVVHNLGKIDWNIDKGYDWAEKFDAYIRDNIVARNYANVIDYRVAGTSARMAFPTTEHFYPLLYTLGAVHAADNLHIFNNSCTLGSLSMTSYLFE